MTIFGMAHTAISILPVALGLASFVRFGKIDPRNILGKAYLATMLIGTVSSWGFLLTKGFTPGQVLTIITLTSIILGTLTTKLTWRPAGYTQSILLTMSYMLLWIFTTTETLTRVPVGQPFATGPNDPALLPVQLTLFTAFLVTISLQILTIRREKLKHTLQQVYATI